MENAEDASTVLGTVTFPFAEREFIAGYRAARLAQDPNYEDFIRSVLLGPSLSSSLGFAIMFVAEWLGQAKNRLGLFWLIMANMTFCWLSRRWRFIPISTAIEEF